MPVYYWTVLVPDVCWLLPKTLLRCASIERQAGSFRWTEPEQKPASSRLGHSYRASEAVEEVSTGVRKGIATASGARRCCNTSTLDPKRESGVGVWERRGRTII